MREKQEAGSGKNNAELTGSGKNNAELTGSGKNNAELTGSIRSVVTARPFVLVNNVPSNTVYLPTDSYYY